MEVELEVLANSVWTVNELDSYQLMLDKCLPGFPSFVASPVRKGDGNGCRESGQQLEPYVVIPEKAKPRAI